MGTKKRASLLQLLIIRVDFLHSNAFSSKKKKTSRDKNNPVTPEKRLRIFKKSARTTPRGERDNAVLANVSSERATVLSFV